MWVEFVGLPGVGKTSLIEKNILEFSQYFKIVESRSPTFFNKIMSIVLYYLKYKYFVNDYILTKKIAHRSSFRFKSKKSRIMFYDSGIIQVVFENLIQNGLRESNFKLDLLIKSKLPQTVIYITDDIDKIIDREMCREKRRFNLSRDVLKERYLNSEKIIKLFLEKYVEHIFWIDSTKCFNSEEKIDVKKILQQITSKT